MNRQHNVAVADGELPEDAALGRDDALMVEAWEDDRPDASDWNAVGPLGYRPPGGARRTLLLIALAWVVVAFGMAVTHAASVKSDPIDYYEDSLFQYGAASLANEGGLTGTHPRLNAPLGADWRDFAIHTDTLTFAQYWVIGWGSNNPIQIVNIAFWLSFFWCAAAFVWAARRLGVRDWLAVGLGIAYAFTAYHFFRGIHHEFMSQYWTLPLMCVAAVHVAVGARTSSWLHRAQWAGIGALCALNGAYYWFFALIVFGLAGLIRLGRDGVRGARAQASAWLAPFVGLVGGTVLALGPSVLLNLSDGPNYRVPSRSLTDSEVHALRPSLLFAPVEGHRLGFLRDWAAGLARFMPGGERQPMAIGLIATAGLALAVAMLGRGVLARTRPRHTTAAVTLATLGAGFLLASLLLGTGGGLHWDLGLAGFVLIRAWGRASIVLVTISLLLLGAVVSRWRPQWVARRIAPLSGGARFASMVGAAVLVGGFGIWDQFPTRHVDTAQLAEYNASKSFYQRLDGALTPGSSVFQLPVVPFPEHWSGSMLYQPLEGVLFAPRLRFSAGAVAGRQGDWQESLIAGPNELFPELRDAGFDAVVIDRRGFSNPDWFIDQYRAVQGVTEIASDAHRVALSIAKVGTPNVRSGYDLVHQPIMSFGEGFNRPADGWSAETSEGGSYVHAFSRSGEMLIRNRTDRNFHACVSMTVTSSGAARRSFEIVGATGKALAKVTLEAAPVTIRFPAVFPPGSTTWSVTASGLVSGEDQARRSSAVISSAGIDGSFDRAPSCEATG